MASNHTPVYGLNQWTLEDGIIMAEFNDDNQKTEQALVDANTAIAALQQTTQVLRADRSALETAIATAKAEAKAGDNTLQTAINAAKAEAKTGDATLQKAIETAKAEAKAGDNTLQTAINAAKAEAKAGDAALQTAINTAKAEAKSGDDTLLQALNAVQTTIPHIATGTYVGTGTGGADNPNSLTFTFEPKLLIVAKDITTELASVWFEKTLNTFTALRGSSGTSYLYDTSSSTSVAKLHLFWSGNTVRWWTSANSNTASLQFNVSGETYHYFAIG